MNDDEPLLDSVVLEKLAELRQEHADLDSSIEAIEAQPLPNQLLIARLKKRKLALRDQITHLEGLLTPDIIA